MSRVVINRLDCGECGEVVSFIVELYSLFRGRRHVANADRVLNEPFVDRFGRVGHEDSALEVRFRKDVWEGSGMIDVATVVD